MHWFVKIDPNVRFSGSIEKDRTKQTYCSVMGSIGFKICQRGSKKEVLSEAEIPRGLS